MITVYGSRETNFRHNGLGVLRPSSCLIYEELNGEYSLTLKHPIDNYEKWKLLEQDRIIKANGQLFRIYKLTHSVMDNEVEVFAMHVFYDLSKNFIRDINIVDKTGKQALNHILENTLYENDFTCDSDITKINSARLVRKNVTSILIGDDENSFLKYWGGELKRDNFNFQINTVVGKNKGMKISYGKNLTGLTATFDMSNIATRIIPVAFDGITLPELYVDSDYVNNYAQPIVRRVDFSDVKFASSPNNTSGEGFATKEEVYAELRRLSRLMFTNDKIDVPEINFNVDFVELSKTEQYKKYSNLETVELGDVVNIHHKVLGINIDARVISYEFNCLTNRYDSIELGSFQTNIFTGISELLKREDVNVQTITDMINVSYENAINEATLLITNGLGGYVVKTRDELLIMDSDNINTAKNVWRWNINGLGFSSTGYNGSYGLAMTNDGQIVADRITAGELNGEIIKANSITTNHLQVETARKIENSQSEEEVRTLIEATLGSFEVTITDKYETKIDDELNSFSNNYYTKVETESKIQQNAAQIATTVTREEVGKVQVGSRNLILKSNVERNVSSADTNDDRYYEWELSQETPLIKVANAGDNVNFIVQIWFSDSATSPFDGVIISDLNINRSSFIINQIDRNTFKATYKFSVGKNSMLGENHSFKILCKGLYASSSKILKVMLEQGDMASQYTEALEDIVADYTERIDTEIQNIIDANQEIQNQIGDILSDNFISESEMSDIVLIQKEIIAQYTNLMNEIALYEASDYFSEFVANLSDSYTTVITKMNDIINNNLSSGKNTLQENLAAYYDNYHMLLYVVAQFLKAQYERVSSGIVQLNDSVNMTITRVEEEIGERKKHMKFSEDGLELFTTINGEIGKFKVVLAENRLSFYEKGNEVAYMSNEKLYISKAEITTSLQIGDVVGRKSSNNGFVFH